MTTHDALSPSARHRWSRCPGSVRESAKYPSVSGPSAIDGTHTHTLLAQCGKNNGDPMKMIDVTLCDEDGTFIVDEARAQRVKLALDYVASRVSFIHMTTGQQPEVVWEHEVDPKHLTGREDQKGHLDIRIFGGGIMEIIDYKDGMLDVPPENNPQLEQYAVAELAAFKLAINASYPLHTMMLTIIQPKIEAMGINPIRSWSMPVAYFIDTVSVCLVREGIACDDPVAPLVPGEVQCRYCPARGGCSALAESVTAQIGFPVVAAKQDLAISVAAVQPNELSNERIQTILDAAPLLRMMIDGVEEEALRRIQANMPVPGYKVVAGRGSRKWALSEEEIEKKLKSMGLPKDAIWKPTLVSPAQVEKITWENRAGERKSLSKRQLATIAEEYVTHLAGAPTLVPESDRRPALVVDASPMFASVGEAAPAAPMELPAFLTGKS